jgi:hypothetical protein
MCRREQILTYTCGTCNSTWYQQRTTREACQWARLWSAVGYEECAAARSNHATTEIIDQLCPSCEAAQRRVQQDEALAMSLALEPNLDIVSAQEQQVQSIKMHHNAPQRSKQHDEDLALAKTIETGLDVASAPKQQAQIWEMHHNSPQPSTQHDEDLALDLTLVELQIQQDAVLASKLMLENAEHLQIWQIYHAAQGHQPVVQPNLVSTPHHKTGPYGIISTLRNGRYEISNVPFMSDAVIRRDPVLGLVFDRRVRH